MTVLTHRIIFSRYLTLTLENQSQIQICSDTSEVLEPAPANLVIFSS